MNLIFIFSLDNSLFFYLTFVRVISERQDLEDLPVTPGLEDSKVVVVSKAAKVFKAQTDLTVFPEKKEKEEWMVAMEMFCSEIKEEKGRMV